ncbi:hypothetical protein HMPREF1988_00609 [Porphyromonas gingivalis F0185]|nr:hypothetical protein HMPREF1988_00609 [Porphyromonas gingivalis F0185]
MNSFAAGLIPCVFRKGQISSIWAPSKQKFPQASIRGVYLRFADTA